MMQRRHFNTRLAALAAAGMASLPAMAQDGALMRIVVGFSPGGSVDAVARLLAERLKEPLGMNVIVENKPGATGRVALGEVQRARPDGRTLVLAAGGAMVIFPWLYPTNLGYDPVKDFTPVSRVTSLGFVISVGPAVPVTDLKGLIAWARANPGKAMYATSGAGSVPHFSGLLLAQTLGLELTHVAYKGGPQAEQELIGGHVPMMIDSPTSTTIDLHRSGKLRILAVTGKTRLPAVPDAAGGGRESGNRQLLRPLRPGGHAGRCDQPHRPCGGAGAGVAGGARKDPGRWFGDGPRRTTRTGQRAGQPAQALGSADQGLWLQGRVGLLGLGPGLYPGTPGAGVGWCSGRGRGLRWHRVFVAVADHTLAREVPARRRKDVDQHTRCVDVAAGVDHLGWHHQQ